MGLVSSLLGETKRQAFYCCLNAKDLGKKEALDIGFLVQDALLDLILYERCQGPPGTAPSITSTIFG